MFDLGEKQNAGAVSSLARGKRRARLIVSLRRIQITAEQLLREAKEKQLEYVPPPPKQKISDPEELAEYRMKKRKEFEDAIRKNRQKMVNWVKYAHWEESQQEIQRARSIWERALDIDYRNIAIWLKYAEMEMREYLAVLPVSLVTRAFRV